MLSARLCPNGKREFPKVKDTTPIPHDFFSTDTADGIDSKKAVCTTCGWHITFSYGRKEETPLLTHGVARIVYFIIRSVAFDLQSQLCCHQQTGVNEKS